MTEPVWTRVGLPTHDEMLQFFWDCHGWVEHSHAKVLTKWLAEPGGLEEYRAEVARWQKRTRAERKYQAARVELAEFTAEAEAWREFAQFGPYPLSPQRDHPLERRLSPPCNELEMQGDHLVLTAYVSARRRGLTHDHIMAETKALPVLETYPAPDMTDWLDGLAEPVTEAAEPATMAEPATEATPWPPEPWDLLGYGEQQQTAMAGTEDW